MAKTTDLDEAFNRYKCLVGICNNAQKRSCSNPSSSFVTTIRLPLAGQKSKNPRNEIAEYFDGLSQKVFDFCFLDLVASFERIIFNTIGNASGEIKGIVRDKYKRPSPFHMTAASFVKKQEDIYNLSGLKSLISEKLPKNNSEVLSEILEHRNWIAHGKRVGKQSTLNINELYNSLKDILVFIHE
jgi:hypothetical protein